VRLQVAASAKTAGAATQASAPACPAARRAGLWLLDSVHWPLPHVATATLLLVTLGLGLLTIGLVHQRTDRLTGTPAPIAEEAARATDPDLATLFVTTLAADRVPREGPLRFVLWRMTLAPGDGFPPWTQSQSCCRGPQFTHVLEGELTVRATDAIAVVRGANGDADVLHPAPGEHVVVGPVDTIVHDFAFPAAYAVRGSRPVQIVNAGLYAGTMPSPWLRHSGYLGGGSQAIDGPLPAGPVTVSLIQAVLPPGGETRPSPFGSLVIAAAGANDANVGTRPDGSLINLGEAKATVYAALLEPTGKPSLSP
jgi:hypothetical protein